MLSKWRFGSSLGVERWFNLVVVEVEEMVEGEEGRS